MSEQRWNQTTLWRWKGDTHLRIDLPAESYRDRIETETYVPLEELQSLEAERDFLAKELAETSEELAAALGEMDR